MRYAVKKGGEWTVCNLVPKTQYESEHQKHPEAEDYIFSEVGSTAWICEKSKAEKVIELD